MDEPGFRAGWTRTCQGLPDGKTRMMVPFPAKPQERNVRVGPRGRVARSLDRNQGLGSFGADGALKPSPSNRVQAHLERGSGSSEGCVEGTGGTSRAEGVQTPPCSAAGLPLQYAPVMLERSAADVPNPPACTSAIDSDSDTQLTRTHTPQLEDAMVSLGFTS